MANKAGRPRDKEGRVKTHILIKKECIAAMDAEVDRKDPRKSSRGKVVETKFKLK